MTWSQTTTALLEATHRAARGPKREGWFALWLLARVVEDAVPDAASGLDPLAERLTLKRLASLETRCASLTLPAPIRRALPGTFALLRESGTTGLALALSQLVAPVTEGLGPQAGQIVTALRNRVRDRAAAGPGAADTGPAGGSRGGTTR